MCGVFHAIGSFFSSPVGHIVTAIGATAVAALTGNPFAIIAAVGATLSAIGSVTKNSTLNTVGAVIGAVGAVGGLADAAGLISSADIFGTSNIFAGGDAIATSAGDAGAGATAAETASPFASGPTGGYQNVGDLIAGQGIGTNTTPSIVDAISGQVVPPEGAIPEAAAAPNVTPAVAINAPGTASGSLTADLASQGQTAVDAVPAGTQTPSVINTPQSGLGPGDASGLPNAGGVQSPVTGVATPYDAGIPGSGAAAQAAVNSVGAVPATPTPSAWDGISTWLEKHPTLALGALMSAGSFLSGATSPLTPAQVTALQAQAQQNQAAATLARQQQQMLAFEQSNMMQPLPVATRTPTPPVGMINRPKLAPVTGTVSV